MRQLDADRHRRVLAHGLEHAGEPALVLIGPQPEIARRDPPVGFDRRRLDHEKAGAGQRQVAEMDGVPVGGGAFVRRVLAHRGDDDPVRKFQAFELDGIEEMHRHWTFRPLLFELGVMINSSRRRN